ncbi:MAG TPA: HAD family hydrolase [Thermoanaerobaculia bacterium]|nr:HAD family hydrolase [Thermoanaerobaculia bacterium]
MSWSRVPDERFGRAIFLDRDGTINMDTHYPHRLEDLELVPGAATGLRKLAQLPALLIVVSNQSGIGLGRYTEQQMTQFNEELRRRIEAVGGRLDAFYFCPHLEPSGRYRKARGCSCCKPAPGLLLEAASDFGLDLGESFMVGDRVSDALAGQRAGARSLIVQTGKVGAEKGDLSPWSGQIVEGLLEAAHFIAGAMGLAEWEHETGRGARGSSQPVAASYQITRTA